MKPSNYLFDLIKSLTKSEKRFFKLASTLQSGNKNYIKIFDTIDKQEEYDEEAIKKEFKNAVFIKHFPSEKNHLYKLILKSLRSFRSDNTISSILQQEIKNIEILYQKALFNESNKFLARAKKKATEHEKFYYLYELLSWEKTLLEEDYEEGEFTKDIDKLIKEERNVIDKLRNLAAYHILFSKINYIFRSGGYVRNKEDKKIVNEISNHPLISEKRTAISIRATSICYYIKGYCALANHDTETSLKHFQKVKSILDKNPKIKNDLSKRYVNTISEILRCHIELGNNKKAELLITETRNLNNNSHFSNYDSKVRIFTTSFLNELRLNASTGEFIKSVELVPSIIDNLDKFNNRISKEKEVLFYYQIAYMNFCIGEFNKSLFWINKVLNDNETQLRRDIYGYSRVFNLLIHFELGNYELLDYILKSTQRYLDKRNLAYQIEGLILKALKSLAKKNSDNTEILENLKLDLLSVKEDDYEMTAAKYFDFESWVQSKLHKTTMAEIIKK